MHALIPPSALLIRVIQPLTNVERWVTLSRWVPSAPPSRLALPVIRLPVWPSLLLRKDRIPARLSTGRRKSL